MIRQSNLTGWKWCYINNAVYELPMEALPQTDKTYTIESNSGNVMVELHGKYLHINRHYHFDGATWAPDFSNGLPYYTQHDAMCQLAAKYDDITRDMADEVLNPRLRRLPIHLWLYHWAVTSWPRKVVYDNWIKT